MLIFNSLQLQQIYSMLFNQLNTVYLCSNWVIHNIYFTSETVSMEVEQAHFDEFFEV